MKHLAGGVGKVQRGWGVVLALVALCMAPGTAGAVAPVNDAFSAAVELEGDSPSIVGTTDEATVEVGEPDHAGASAGQSVWYSWRPSRSGLVRVECESSFDTIVAVYRGASVGSLSEIGSDHAGFQCGPPDLQIRALAGVEYRIAVDTASDGGSGSFTLILENTSETPPNDDFVARSPMRDLGGNAFVLGTTEGAGREAGEPTHGGRSVGSSVWFTWTAHRTGPSTVYPCHGSFHPLIEVFAGDRLATLKSLQSPADIGLSDPLCALGGRGGVSFPSVAGETYALAVDGSGGEWGSFELKLREAPLLVAPRPPETFIRKRIRRRGRSVKIFFAVRGGPGLGTHYLCKLDRRRFRPCSSPRTFRRLSARRHRFAVIAVDEAGLRDPSPAVRHFRVHKRRGKRQ